MYTYQQAFNLITEAYIKREIQPMNPKFCFCGTLSPDHYWSMQHLNPIRYPYTTSEYGRLERALFSKMSDAVYVDIMLVDSRSSDKLKYTEDELFAGMCAALEVLKQIHIERGEVID